MLLETLDVRKNDVIIYSKNIFDFRVNFKVIFKNERTKQAKSISYFEACDFVNDPSPKNLIIYRLLTNVTQLDASSTKYGYFIKVNDRMELVYYDPIFAIKDLRHLRFNLDPEHFRFKIQQVGLTSLAPKLDEEINYSEVFSIDLRASEAQNQNDKIYADAIYAFDESFIGESDSKEFTGTLLNGPEISLKGVLDEGNPLKSNLNKAKLDQRSDYLNVRENKIDVLKNALGIKITEQGKSKAFSKFLEENTPGKSTKLSDESPPNLMELFKKAKKSNEAKKIENDPHILRLKID
ncbi:MAG: hypothetical protein PVH88_08445 [Ignavibacteria bacterium]|jgi:hypothetical protein